MSPKLKVKHKETGLVYERWNADCSAMVNSGHYDWADEDDLTIRERLNALRSRREEFEALAKAAFGSNSLINEKDADIIERLVPLIETGKFTLPADVPERRRKPAA